MTKRFAAVKKYCREITTITIIGEKRPVLHHPAGHRRTTGTGPVGRRFQERLSLPRREGGLMVIYGFCAPDAPMIRVNVYRTAPRYQ